MGYLKITPLTLALFAYGCATPEKSVYKYDPSGPLPGHSNHGEAFNAGPRQAAYFISGTGNVSFPITTSSPKAQKFFNQGVGQLHGFWYLEAERSFRQVLILDPGNPMAYWGMAMANNGNSNRAKGLVEKAETEKERTDERE